MTDLAQTALDFCRECLGWEDARFLNGATSVFHGHGGGRLHYTDLNAVMEAVRGWCVRKKLGFTICCDGSGFEVAVFSSSFEEIDEEAISDILCHALLAACVEAARKLKAAA